MKLVYWFICSLFFFSSFYPQDVFPSQDSILHSLKDDFMVNSLDGKNGADQSGCDIAVDGNGHYCIVWRDYRNGHAEIAAQFYDENGRRLGGNVIVSNQSNDRITDPVIAGSPKGGFVVVWAQTYHNLYGQRFSSDGIWLSSNFSITSTGYGAAEYPSIAFNNKGNFIVFWSEDMVDGYRGFCRIFDRNANAITKNIPVLDPDMTNCTGLSTQRCAAADDLGNFVVVWSSYSPTERHNILYLQRFDENGLKLGENRPVSTPDEFVHSSAISATGDGSFLIVWERSIQSDVPSELNAKLYSGVTGKFTINTVTLDKSGLYRSYNTVTDKDRFICVYSDWRSGTTKYISIEKDGSISGSDTLHLQGPLPGVSKTSIDSSGRLYHTYIFGYYFYSDIYFEKFGNQFNPLNTVPEMVNDDVYSSEQRNPFVHYNNFGEAIVLWTDHRNGRPELYAQVYDNNSEPVGNNMLIGTYDPDYSQPGVTSLSDGTFVAAYSSSRFTYPHTLEFQKISRSGGISGDSVKIITDDYPGFIRLSVNESDEIFACWYSSPLNLYAFGVQKFNSELHPVSEQRRIFTDIHSSGYNTFDLSVNKNFKVLIAWSEHKRNYSTIPDKILALICNEKGEAESDTMVIKEMNQNYNPEVFCSIDDKNNFAVLIDNVDTLDLIRSYGSGSEYVFENVFEVNYPYDRGSHIISFQNQRCFVIYNNGYEITGVWTDDNKRTTAAYPLWQFNSYLDRITERSHGAVYNDKLFFVYEGTRHRNTGYDIFGNIRRSDQLRTDAFPFLPPGNNDQLFNNYPNPFNAGTKIIYEVQAYHQVKLAVYDVLGRIVEVLVDEFKDKGVYEIDFNASGLSSGIYFLRMEAFDTRVKKMMLVK